MQNSRKLCLVVTAIMVVLPAASASADTGTDVQQIIRSQTGAAAALVTAGQSAGSISIQTGRDRAGDSIPSYAQHQPSGVRMMAALDNPAQNAVDFALVLPTGAELKPLADGSMVVTRYTATGVEVFATVAKPWAADADGKELPTSYTVKGNLLTQNVDLTGATFPVVADPSVQLGFYVVPVVYETFSRYDTFRLWNNVWWQVVLSGLLCAYSGPAAAGCSAMAAIYWHSIYNALDYAVHNYHRCFKVRLPYGGVAFYWVFSAYSVYC